MSLTAEGTTAANGNQFYSYDWFSADGTWNVTAGYSADWRCDPKARISGEIKVKNLAEVSRTFEFTMDVPICPAVNGGSLLGGSSTLSLKAFGDQGFITCDDQESGSSLVQARADQLPAGYMFWCPFNIMTDASGNASAFSNFGAPVPSAPGPSAFETIGIRHQFVLSGGDQATFVFTTTFMALATNDEPNCPADISGDGQVDSIDLALILGQWGQSTDCFEPTPQGDLDKDQVVDASDLAILLGAWGACQSR